MTFIIRFLGGLIRSGSPVSRVSSATKGAGGAASLSSKTEKLSRLFNSTTVSATQTALMTPYIMNELWGDDETSVEEDELYDLLFSMSQYLFVGQVSSFLIMKMSRIQMLTTPIAWAIANLPRLKGLSALASEGAQRGSKAFRSANNAAGRKPWSKIYNPTKGEYSVFSKAGDKILVRLNKDGFQLAPHANAKNLAVVGGSAAALASIFNSDVAEDVLIAVGDYLDTITNLIYGEDEEEREQPETSPMLNVTLLQLLKNPGFYERRASFYLDAPIGSPKVASLIAHELRYLMDPVKETTMLVVDAEDSSVNEVILGQLTPATTRVAEGFDTIIASDSSSFDGTSARPVKETPSSLNAVLNSFS